MDVKKVWIGNIPAIIWGNDSDSIIIAAHGRNSSKVDDCMWVLAEEAMKKGYQVLTFDFPQHGERMYERRMMMPDKCVDDLKTVYEYVKKDWKKVSIFGCSMGCYFELVALSDIPVERAWFLSPLTDMAKMVKGLMDFFGISEEELKEQVFIENDDEPLYYPYYEYLKNHPVTNWPHKTYLLRGDRDRTCGYEEVDVFAEKFGCELTEIKDCEHWFHTDEELEFFRKWLIERL